MVARITATPVKNIARTILTIDLPSSGLGVEVFVISSKTSNMFIDPLIVLVNILYQLLSFSLVLPWLSLL